MYLTVSLVSYPFPASNARGEGDGNTQILQKVNTEKCIYTIISGKALKSGVRRVLQEDEEANTWRKQLPYTEDLTSATNYVYGPDDSPVMMDALPKSPAHHDDSLTCGYMAAAKESGDAAVKSRAQVCVSDAISTTPYNGDMLFSKGLSAVADRNQPFNEEVHHTRYNLTATFNLDTLAVRDGAAARFLSALLQGFQAGGNHACHANEIQPEIVLWRFHKAPGQSGLYHMFTKGVPVDDINLDEAYERAKNLGFTFKAAGVSLEMSVADGLNSMLDDIKMHQGAK